MRLQVKELQGPEELPEQRNRSNTRFEISVLSTDNNDENVFTCKFNRNIITGHVDNNDEFPLSITCYIYYIINDNNGNNNIQLQQTETLLLQQINIIENDSFKFKLTVPINVPENVFYLHCIINNPDVQATNISITSSQYHTTIKRVSLYGTKEIKYVYWSSNEIIQSISEEEARMDMININHDAFLHIKTEGMYKDYVNLIFYIDNEEIYRVQRIQLNGNKVVVGINVRMLIIRSGTFSYNIDDPINCNITVWVYEDKPGPITTPSINNSLFEQTNVYISPNNLLSLFNKDNKYSNPLLVTNNHYFSLPTQLTSTGTVYVNVNSEEVESVVPTLFTDFLVGYVVHIEGVGKAVARHNNNSNTNSYFTVYPIKVFEYKVSDLVVAGLISLSQAIYLAPNTRTAQDLKSSFNKVRALIAENTSLLSIFQDANSDNRANGNNIRKLLQKLKSNRPNYSNFICRDAWQRVSKGVVQQRNIERYGRYQDCPYGEYFLNYRTTGTFRVYVSRYTVEGNSENNNNNYLCLIDTFGNPINSPNLVNRSEIAVHQGSSTYSTGCLTFNISYTAGAAQPRNAEFDNLIYPENENNRQLNFICLDERNAIQRENDMFTYKNREYDLYRHYDLVNSTNSDANSSL